MMASLSLGCFLSTGPVLGKPAEDEADEEDENDDDMEEGEGDGDTNERQPLSIF